MNVSNSLEAVLTADTNALPSVYLVFAVLTAAELQSIKIEEKLVNVFCRPVCPGVCVLGLISSFT